MGRDVVRFNYAAGNSTYWRLNLATTPLAGNAALATIAAGKANVTTDVTDIFLVRPSHLFVVCRTRMPYQVADYTNMNSVITNMNRDGAGATVDEVHTGGFGDYVDFNSRLNPVCISHDYTDKITCWNLTPAGGAVSTNAVHRKF